MTPPPLKPFAYHVVALELSVKEASSAGAVAGKFEEVINHYAAQGWEYVALETVPVTVVPPPPGCLGAFSGKAPQPYTKHLPQIVFRKHV